MSGDDAFDRGQANAAAGKLFRRMQTLEGTEQFVRVSHVKTGTVVPDKIHRLLVGARLSSDRNFGRGLFRGELPGVGDQVLQDLAQQRWVRPHQQAGLDRHSQHTRQVGFRPLLDDLDHLCAHVYGLPTEAAARQLRQRKQTIGQLTHALHTAAYPVQVVVGALAGVGRQRF